MRELSARSPGAALSVEMAPMTPLTFFSGVGEVAKYAPNFGSALALLADSAEIAGDRAALDFDDSGSKALFTFAHPQDLIDNGRLSEVGIALMWRLCKYMLGERAGFNSVNFGFTANGSNSAYFTFFQCPVTHTEDSHQGSVTLEREMLQFENPKSNPILFKLASRHLEEFRAELRRDGYSRNMLQLRSATFSSIRKGAFSPRAVASEARLSLRTAQRLAQYRAQRSPVSSTRRAPRSPRHFWPMIPPLTPKLCPRVWVIRMNRRSVARSSAGPTCRWRSIESCCCPG